MSCSFVVRNQTYKNLGVEVNILPNKPPAAAAFLEAVEYANDAAFIIST